MQLTTPTLDPVPEILGWLRIADPVFGDDSVASFAWFVLKIGTPGSGGHRPIKGRDERERCAIKPSEPKRVGRAGNSRSNDGVAISQINRRSEFKRAGQYPPRQHTSQAQCDGREDHCLIGEWAAASLNPSARTNCTTIGGTVLRRRLSEAVERRITGLA